MVKNLSKTHAAKKSKKAVPQSTENGGRPPVQFSRIGRISITGYFMPEVLTALKIIAAGERVTIQTLVAEGLNKVLTERGHADAAALALEKPLSRQAARQI